MTVVVGFRCDITSCELARRGVRRGVVGVGESGGVRRVWAWRARGRRNLDPQSRAVFLVI